MRRLFVLLLVAACLLPEAGPVRAQATADQLNKLSLEALTTPAPGGNPGSSYRRRAAHRSFYHGLGRSRHSYGARAYGYHRGGRRVARSYRRPSYQTYAPQQRRAYTRHETGRSARRSASHAHRRHVAPYHRLRHR